MYLFTHHRQLNCNEVSASCKYYAKIIRYPITTIVDGKTTITKGIFHNELEWTYSYFCNNVKPGLYEIVQSEFTTNDPLKKGGPLFLKLLLDHLILLNDANEAALMSTVFNYNIKNLNKTEDIHSGHIKHYRHHCHNSGLQRTALLDECLQHLTSIYQTTSVRKFNRTFAKLEDDITYSHRFQKVTESAAVRNHPSLLSSSIIIQTNTPEYCQFVFSLANKTYKELNHFKLMWIMLLQWSPIAHTHPVNSVAGPAASLTVTS